MVCAKYASSPRLNARHATATTLARSSHGAVDVPTKASTSLPGAGRTQYVFRVPVRYGADSYLRYPLQARGMKKRRG